MTRIPFNDLMVPLADDVDIIVAMFFWRAKHAKKARIGWAVR